MSSPILIGLNGYKESGKDTAFQGIKDVLIGTEWTVIRDGFADRLKLSAARALGFQGDLEQCREWADHLKNNGKILWHYGYQSEENTLVGVADEISGRQFLQHYGTESHRDIFGDDFWIDAVIPDRRDEYLGRPDIHENTILCITDVRFPNEAEAIREADGKIWRINRDSVAPKGEVHVSERPLPDHLVDVEIDNNGNLGNLTVNLVNALHRVVNALREQDIRVGILE